MLFDDKVFVYQHFKGATYRLIGFAKHSETGEQMAVYRNSDGQLYVRPADMWEDEVEVDGKKMPRFKFIGAFHK